MELTIDQLQKLNTLAIERGYNRSLSDELFEDACAETKATMLLDFPHAYKSGEPCEMHYRTMWKVKLKNGSWATVQMDIEESVYLALPAIQTDKIKVAK